MELYSPYYARAMKGKRFPIELFRRQETAAGAECSEEHVIRQVWKSIVEDYSGRSLSNPEDCLPALAGVIVELQKLWNDVCLAGMWRRIFLASLP